MTLYAHYEILALSTEGMTMKTNRICAGEYEMTTEHGVFMVSKSEYERDLWWVTYPDGLREDCYNLTDAKGLIDLFNPQTIHDDLFI